MKNGGQDQPISCISFADELTREIASLRAITRMATGDVETADVILAGFLERILDGRIFWPHRIAQDVIELLYIEHFKETTGTGAVEIDIGKDEKVCISIEQLFEMLEK